MDEKKAEIRLTISLKDNSNRKEVQANVEVEGADLEIMEIAEIAQQIQLVGEATMERILIRVLNENNKLIGATDRYLN